MTFLAYRSTCRKHDISKEMVFRAPATQRNIQRGYDAIDGAVFALGCDDSYTTYSVVQARTEREIAAWYEKAVKFNTKSDINAEYAS